MSISRAEPVGIDDLCDEILLEIIQLVGAERQGDDEWSSRDLFNLAVCSRRFYQLVEPELYTEFAHSSELKHRRYFLLFVKRILARPDLAQCLKRLWAAACSNEAAFLLPVGSELAEEDWKRIRKVVNEASRTEDEAEIWIRALELGRWAAVMALLLSVTPNLEELEIKEWFYHNLDYEHLLEALERARVLQDSGEESPFSMSKLRDVSVNYYDMKNGYKFEQVVPFLQLKSVETFRGDMVSQIYVQFENYYDLRPTPTLTNPLPKLTTKDVTFTNSVINHYDMPIILGCFPQLERFHYEYGGSVVGRAEFEPPQMMAALEQLKPCLKDLTLVTYEWTGSTNHESYPIGSLADFPKLVSITANASIMVGEDWSLYGDSDYEDDGIADSQDLVDAVPPTLESLSLKDCKRHIVDHIFELVSLKPFRTPALRKLDLGWEGVKYPDKESPREPILHPGFRKEEVTKLMAECKAAGIEIAIEYLPPRVKYASFVRREPLDDMSAALGLSRPIPTCIEKYFGYPYEGYEEYCEQNGCYPETGNQTPPPWDYNDFPLVRRHMD
ncbi:unnamed protein product [Calypogeia fissa]